MKKIAMYFRHKNTFHSSGEKRLCYFENVDNNQVHNNVDGSKEWLNMAKNAGDNAEKIKDAVVSFLENDGEVSHDELESLTDKIIIVMAEAGAGLSPEEIAELRADFNGLEGNVVKDAIKADILGYQEASEAELRGKNRGSEHEEGSTGNSFSLHSPKGLDDEGNGLWLLDQIEQAKGDIKHYDAVRRDILATTSSRAARHQKFAAAKRDLGNPFSRLQILKNQYITLHGREAYKRYLVGTGDLQIVDATRGRAEWEAKEAAEKASFLAVMKDQKTARQNHTTIGHVRMMRQFAEEGLLPHQQMSTSYAIANYGSQQVRDFINHDPRTHGRPKRQPTSVYMADKNDPYAGKDREDKTPHIKPKDFKEKMAKDVNSAPEKKEETETTDISPELMMEQRHADILKDITAVIDTSKYDVSMSGLDPNIDTLYMFPKEGAQLPKLLTVEFNLDGTILAIDCNGYIDKEKIDTTLPIGEQIQSIVPLVLETEKEAIPRHAKLLKHVNEVIDTSKYDISINRYYKDSDRMRISRREGAKMLSGISLEVDFDEKIIDIYGNRNMDEIKIDTSQPFTEQIKQVFTMLNAQEDIL